LGEREDIMKKNTYETVMNAIDRKGIEKVREIIYSDGKTSPHTHEGVAMSSFINSRMFKKDIIKKLQ